MRVALVHETSFPNHQGSAERYLHDLAAHLDRSGHEVTLVLGAAGFSAHVEGGIRAVNVAAKGGRSRMTTRAAAWLSRNRQDLVHALSPAGALAGLVTRHPTVFSELGILDSGRGRLGLTTWHAALRFSDVVACPSRQVADAVVAAGGRPTILPLAVDPPTERPLPPTGDLVVLAGFPEWNATSVSEHETLGAALSRVLERHPTARLVLPAGATGTAPRGDWLPADRVRRLPRRLARWSERWPDEGAHVVVVNGDWEAPRAILETLATGRPAVVADGHGADELAAGDLVQTFAPGDPQGLADAILSAAELASAEETCARAIAVAAGHSWDALDGELMAVYDRALGRVLASA